MNTMEARLQKWGNSDGVRIPKAFLQSLNLKTNDKIIIEQVDDKIVISRAWNDCSYSTPIRILFAHQIPAETPTSVKPSLIPSLN